MAHPNCSGRQVPPGVAAAAGLLALAGATSAQAAMITQAVPVSAGPINFADFGVDAYVAPFDPALGTLTAVDLRLAGTLTPGLETFDMPSPLPAVFAAPVTLTPVVSIASPGRVTQTLPAQTLSFAQGDTPFRQVVVGAPASVNLSETVAPNTLPVLPGRGVDIYITGRSNPAFGVPSPRFFSAYEAEDLATLSGQLQVTYTYTPPSTSGSAAGGTLVPEPASLDLIGAGLAGLGLVRRWSRHR